MIQFKLILFFLAFSSYVNCSDENYDCNQWRRNQPKNRSMDHSCQKHVGDCGSYERCMKEFTGKDRDMACHCRYKNLKSDLNN
jgi:hypothetical protein